MNAAFAAKCILALIILVLPTVYSEFTFIAFFHVESLFTNTPLNDCINLEAKWTKNNVKCTLKAELDHQRLRFTWNIPFFNFTVILWPTGFKKISI